MNKARIVSVLVLLAVLGAFGAVYQFYFKEKLEAYSRDQELLAALENTYSELETTFSGYQPEVITQEWRAQSMPWEQAVTQRTAYFQNGGWYDAPRPPEDVPILRFWYGEEANKMVADLYQKLTAKLPYGSYPLDIYTMLGVPRMEQWAGFNVDRQQVINSLSRLSFGISAVELLLDAGATRIDQVLLWPFEEKTHHNGLLTSRTIALAFSMTLENLVKFLEQLRQSEQFWTVDGLKLDYPYIAHQMEPQLSVQMLLTQAVAVPKPEPGSEQDGALMTASTAMPGAPFQLGAPSAQSLFQMQGMYDEDGLDARGRAALTVQEPGIFGKAWKWFKRYVLYTN